MKKYIYLFVMLFALHSYAQKEKTVFELDASRSMCMAGKGAGQDAAINPYMDRNSIALVQNLGENTFSIRVEYQGKLFQTQAIKAGKSTEISLRKGSVLYIDTDLQAKAKVEFKEGVN